MTKQRQGEALSLYSREKNIPPDFLKNELGARSHGNALALPYYDEEGRQTALRLRHPKGHEPRFSWEPGGRMLPYGLWLPGNRGKGPLVLAEGESDAHSLWQMRIPALGIPGAALFKKEWIRCLGGRPLYLHREPDAGGEAFVSKTAGILKEAGYPAPVCLLSAHALDPRCKDISDLYLLRGAEEARELLRRQAGQYLPLDTRVDEAGEAEPLPPKAPAALPPFPLDALCQFGRGVVETVSASIQAPADLCACFMLGALSACCVGKVQAEPWEGYREPVQLYLLGSANPSERKSPALAALFGPVYRYQREENERRAPLIRRSISEREGAQLRLKRAVESGKKEEIDRAHRALEELKEVKPFELILSDATTEALAQHMARNEGRAALVSAEGGMLATLCGRYSSQQTANVDVILHGYSGEPMSQHRIARGQLNIQSATLSLCLAAQPGVVQRFITNEAMLECGMVSRFLVCSPHSGLGNRLVQGPPMNAALMAAWELRLQDLLGMEQPLTLRLTPEAAQAFEAWGLEIEGRLGPEGDLRDLAGGFGGKLRGNTARVAALLCLLEHGAEFCGGLIHRRHMDGAVLIARYFTAHMLALCGAEDLSPEADAVLKTLRKSGLESFSQNKVREKVRGMRGLERAEDVALALAELEDAGYIQLDLSVSGTQRGAGRPRSPVYRICGAAGG